MKVTLFASILVISTLCFAQAPTANQKPLGKNQIIALLKARMESEVLAKTVEERGIEFEPSDDDLQALRKAGAQDVLIKAVRAARPRPLTGEQVLQLVVAGVPSQRAVTLVNQRGIDFVPDEEYLGTLRVAGGDETLVAALRAASEAVTAEISVVTSPNAEVYLDGVLQGRASAQGELIIKSKPGVHTVKISLAGKKDTQRELTLVAGKANMVDAPLEHIVQVKVNSKDGLKYAWIPPGSFMMGCSPGDIDCILDEEPAHRVTISKGFWMGQTEVTVGAYKRFARETGKGMPPKAELMGKALNGGWANDALPIVNVNWDEATAYCAWVGGRLPTEAEWEYAARAGSTEARYGPLDEIAWYADNSGEGRIDSASLIRNEARKYGDRLRDNGNRMRGVAQKRANGFGLFDTLGNVYEWVSDWYGRNYYQGGSSSDPLGPGSGRLRILRGGSWLYNPTRDVRVTRRWLNGPDVRRNVIGVRCVGQVNP